MKNITILSKNQPYKHTTEYAIFFSHKDLRARLDLECANELVSLEDVKVIAIGQIKSDLDDPITVADVRKSNAESNDTEARIQEFLSSGFQSTNIPGLVDALVIEFGND